MRENDVIEIKTDVTKEIKMTSRIFDFFGYVSFYFWHRLPQSRDLLCDEFVTQ